jgi:ATP phosphoribosyltransferase regulatory subunit
MRLPAGVRDWLPEELALKRAAEESLRGVFVRHGYAEVQTPGFEFFDVLEAGLGAQLAEQAFQFTDRRGGMLSLRPDMTTPIARLVASRMQKAPLPLRLCYVQPTYRYEDPQEGRMREFTQAGVELIGERSVDADAESLFTALEALDALGLRDARVDINHVSIVDGVLAGLDLAPEAVVECKRLVAARNLVGLRAFAEKAGYANRFGQLKALTLSRGTGDVLAFAEKLCRTTEGRRGIERLATIVARAAERGASERISIDLSLLRDFAYYTGFVFEGFVAELGFAIAGGGRYDSLLPRFGMEASAVGWSLSVERVLIALERRRRLAASGSLA